MPLFPLRSNYHLQRYCIDLLEYDLRDEEGGGSADIIAFSAQPDLSVWIAIKVARI